MRRCYFFFFFFKQKTAYEMLRSLVGSEMCIRDRSTGVNQRIMQAAFARASIPVARTIVRNGSSAAKGGARDFHPHAPAADSWHMRAATTMSTTMWFWIMYRFYHDGKALLGIEHPWDAHH
eukprot:TRINITY_DN24504_c0_g1_i16.p1 TRINITY_DN24504_c0_g1~~TRINITY_DN24504_c0_g1_i16.p1  ORF type:complete len:121 (+),score=47.98 TRINITY_DN24504_c0_g1_i16:85-447(+)